MELEEMDINVSYASTVLEALILRVAGRNSDRKMKNVNDRDVTESDQSSYLILSHVTFHSNYT